MQPRVSHPPVGYFFLGGEGVFGPMERKFIKIVFPYKKLLGGAWRVPSPHNFSPYAPLLSDHYESINDFCENIKKQHT